MGTNNDLTVMKHIFRASVSLSRSSPLTLRINLQFDPDLQEGKQMSDFEMKTIRDRVAMDFLNPHTEKLLLMALVSG